MDLKRRGLSIRWDMCYKPLDVVKASGAVERIRPSPTVVTGAQMEAFRRGGWRTWI